MMAVSDFEVDDISRTESLALIHQATANEPLPRDVEIELVHAAPHRPLSALAYAAYTYEVLIDPEATREARRVLEAHLSVSIPSLVAAVSSMIAWLDNWDWWTVRGGPDTNPGTLQREMLGLSTSLRPDWVTNWIQLLDLYRHERNWPAAIDCARRLVAIGEVEMAELDGISNAFETLFTGRVGWSKDAAADLMHTITEEAKADGYPAT